MRPVLTFLVAMVLLTALGCDLGEKDKPRRSLAVRCSSTPNDPEELGLRRTVLQAVDDGIEVTWTTSRPMDTRAYYWVVLSGADGLMRRTLSLFFVGDELAEVFGQEPHFIVAIDDLDEEMTFPDGQPEVEGSTVRMVFPHSAIEREGESLQYWYAGVDVGRKRDLCPDPPDDWGRTDADTYIHPRPLRLPQHASLLE
jgi:hypothetical protein